MSKSEASHRELNGHKSYMKSVIFLFLFVYGKNNNSTERNLLFLPVVGDQQQILVEATAELPSANLSHNELFNVLNSIFLNSTYCCRAGIERMQSKPA